MSVKEIVRGAHPVELDAFKSATGGATVQLIISTKSVLFKVAEHPGPIVPTFILSI